MRFDERIPIFLKLGFREAALPQLRQYVDLLWASNEKLNLFSRKMPFEDLIDNHVIDSMLPLYLFPKNARVVADFGSGGGLPAVLFAIQFPEVVFRLYEKSKMKQDFLRECRVIAPNVEIHGEIPIRLPGVELVMARAFKPIDVTLDVSRDYHANQGKYFLLKGRREKIDEEISLARKKFKDLNVRVEPLQSPVLEVERHVVLIGRDA